MTWISCSTTLRTEVTEKVIVSWLAIMFKKPVWDNLCFFLTWNTILLEEAIRRWTHWSRAPKSVPEKSPHPTYRTPLTPPEARTVETRQDGSMISCRLCEILTVPSIERHQDSSDYAMFFQTVVGGMQISFFCSNWVSAFLSAWSSLLILLWPQQSTFMLRTAAHWTFYFFAPFFVKLSSF